MIGKTGGLRSTLLPGLRLLTVALAASCLLALSACEDPATEKDVDQHAAEARKSLDSIITQAPPTHYNPLVVTDKVWTGSTALRMQRGLPLPTRYEGPRGITLVSSEPMTITDIANAITNQTGIAVRVIMTGMSAAPALPGAANNGMPIAYEGPLSGLLERVAGHFGVNWHYNGATLEISRFETRVFVVESLPGNVKIEEGMQDDSSSSGGGGGAAAGGGSSQQNTMTQNSKTSIDIKYWDELGQTLSSMLAGNGTAVVSPSLGTVTITTTPEVMHTIAQYINQENQRLSRQIAINVQIYVVSLENGMDFDVAFNTAVNKVANAFAGNIAGVTAPATISGFTGGGTMSVAVLNPNNTNQSLVSGIVTALAGIGNATTIASFPLVTLNNRPVSRRVGEQISYVASSETTVAGTSGTPTTSLTPGTVPEGFSVQLTPRLLDDGRILMEYSLSDIDLLTLKVFNSQCGDITSGVSSGCSTTGSTTIESPDTVQRIFVQQSVLKSGSTLIIGGAEEEDLAQNKQGVISPNFFGLGGGSSSNRTHTMIFFALTPQVLDIPHSEQE